jgi:polar amino acid transport system substrate-binding protein
LTPTSLYEEGFVRKLYCLAAVMAVALAFAACGGSDKKTETTSTGTGGTAAPKLNLKSDGTLTAATEFPVKGFVELPISNPTGYEVDLTKAIAAELKIPKVKWVNTPFANLFSPAPKPYDFDINEITITPERQKVVDFSDPYFNADQGFLITKGGPGEQAKSIADMKGLQFGFQATTTGGDYIKNTIKPDKQPREYSTLGAATNALKNGQIDAFVMDVAIGSQVVKQLPNDIAMTGQFKTGEQYGILFQKGNALKADVNKALATLKSGGKLTELQKKWFPGTESLPEFH